MCRLVSLLFVYISLGFGLPDRSLCWVVLLVLLIGVGVWYFVEQCFVLLCLRQQIWSVLLIDNLSWHDIHLRQHVTVTDDMESMFSTLAQMIVDIAFRFSRARLGLQMILISSRKSFLL